MKKVFALLSLTLVFLALPVTALAAEFRVSPSQSGSADVAKTETASNLYIAGSTVNVSGDTKRDLTAAGNSLNLSGVVEDSLFAVGSNINVSGKVGKNVRIAGSNISLTSPIGGDLFVAGSSVTLANDAKVSGDMFVAAGTFIQNAEVDGRVRILGGDVTINSKINGDLEVDATKLTLGDNVVIGGNLIYRSDKEATISKSAVIKGTTDFQKIETKNYNKTVKAGFLGVFGVFGVLMGLALLFVLVYLLPRTSRELTAKTLASFWTNLGWGFLSFVIAPTALILIALTVVGLKIAGVLLVLYLLSLMTAFIFATLIIGAQTLKWFYKGDYRIDWATILVGTLAVIILGLIPVLGGLIILAVALAVLGQIVGYTGAFLKSQR